MPHDAAIGDLAPIHFVGRFDASDPVGPSFAWSGSAIWSRFVGTEISVELAGSPNQFEVVIDGQAQPVLVTTGGTQTYQLASGLAEGEHDIRITRRTEAFFGENQFLGFPGATLVETPAPTRLIEMVGDSITCGYGVLGDSATCSFSAETEAATRAWGALAAGELGAAQTAIAWSGKGVFRNCCGDSSELMPVLFERQDPNDPTSVWSFDYAPDVVVIGLGTNDFSGGDPGAAFVDAYAAFVTQIRGHYPDAWLILASSPMLEGDSHAQHLGYLETVASSAGDRVRVLDLATQLASDGYGCDYHPNEITQQKMADALVGLIHELGALDWSMSAPTMHSTMEGARGGDNGVGGG